MRLISGVRWGSLFAEALRIAVERTRHEEPQIDLGVTSFRASEIVAGKRSLDILTTTTGMRMVRRHLQFP